MHPADRLEQREVRPELPLLAGDLEESRRARVAVLVHVVAEPGDEEPGVALAAGLLGGGSRFLGVTEDCGRFLHDVLAEAGELPSDEDGWDALAVETVEQRRAEKKFVPGLGHHVHKDGDPRTPRLFAIADAEGLRGPHLELFAAIGRVHPRVLGKTLPLNGAGVCGAALADLGLPLELLRGFALLARTAGLIGQLAEELRRPVANDIFLSVDLNNRSVPPDPHA